MSTTWLHAFPVVSTTGMKAQAWAVSHPNARRATEGVGEERLMYRDPFKKEAVAWAKDKAEELGYQGVAMHVSNGDLRSTWRVPGYDGKHTEPIYEYWVYVARGPRFKRGHHQGREGPPMSDRDEPWRR